MQQEPGRSPLVLHVTKADKEEMHLLRRDAGSEMKVMQLVPFPPLKNKSKQENKALVLKGRLPLEKEGMLQDPCPILSYFLLMLVYTVVVPGHW